VIVGNKSDLREDRAVSRAQAVAVSEEWSHVPYYETSAKLGVNVDKAFVDLCGQIIDKDMASAQVRDHDITRRETPLRNPARRRQRREIHCTIL
jgi:Ras-related protein Rap-1B